MSRVPDTDWPTIRSISTVSPSGVRNLAPYSFFNAFNYVPPIIGFASVGWKDSVENAKATGVFVWNLANMELAQAMNATAATVEASVDEFELAGLTAVPSQLVMAPRVLESRVNFECRVTQIIQLETSAGEAVPSWLVLGEVVAVHIDRSLIKDGVYQTAEAHPILRAGRMGDYAEIRPDAMFEMKRPR
jgi:flavin reductase (DIM6/NTAB) family NADH-FMN oxidoreductase RutF